MKLLFLFLFTCLSATAASAQTSTPKIPVEVSVSAENPTFFVNSGAWLVKVKITNNKKKTLKTKDLDRFVFIFDKPNQAPYEEKISGIYDIEERKIKPGESFEFEADLRKLIWNKPPSQDATYIPDAENGSPYQPALSGYYEVYMLIPNCEIFSAPGTENSCIVPSISCVSNKLAVKVEVKTDK
jgi:hypothetical protein